ncbi:resolvase [Nitrobacter sp. Nb-311A]|uniref:recombinase family protein n=1 Tax=Nitrobacter sp. Nb-311A TaxID=314253 RepID=UPI0000684AAB|nr:recombinase family protein [Nitrobacter sp. Nb-311A]EAQ34142.1 resolvase [Nitrobacter sp. Nb-311A]
MKPADNRVVRCAIYTRVSTDTGLDQEFNSLDAQYDASQAYIRSQAHAGWSLVTARYDDGGFSGGSTDRPALQRLLADVAARRIHIIVVYKVDRLTRSLADFAKLVELFDAHGVSFVSVTQQFNTTTSMGRLTLNVLLSFAQFEREVTSERIRDKIAASKRKGLWVGGMVPLGYILKDGQLHLQEEEANTVRLIFQRYLELGSVNRLVKDLKERGFKSKVRQLASGGTRGGVPFTQGPLFYMLRNRFYLGEVRFKGEILPGPQPALLDRALFEAVQKKLTEQRSHHTTTRIRTRALLAGLLFDDAGHRMILTYASRNRVRHRYYVSAPCIRGQTDEPVGSVTRVPASDIEASISKAVMANTDVDEPSSNETLSREVLERFVIQIEVRKNQLAIHLRSGENDIQGTQDDPDPDESRAVATRIIVVPWKKPSRPAREILLPANTPEHRARPMKAERRSALIRAIGRGRLWLQEIVDGRETIESLAARQHCSTRHIKMTISLAFLAPTLVTAAVEGRFPRGIGVAALRDAPAEWSQQMRRLGLAPTGTPGPASR